MITDAKEIQARPLSHTFMVVAVVGLVTKEVVVRAGGAQTLGLVSDAIVAVFVIYLIRHMLFLTAAFQTPHRKAAGATGGLDMSATVIVPCRDEERVIGQLVASLEKLQAPTKGLQIILIDDRSADQTPKLLDAAVSSRPTWSVLHRTKGDTPGKSAALNAAAKQATGDIIVVFDADHRPDPDCVVRLAAQFDDPEVAAAQGRCIIGNSKESGLARLVALDYLCGYLVNMVGRQSVFGSPAYGGANCAVRASALQEVGGWNDKSVTEDTDLTIRLNLAGYKVRFDAEALDVEQAVTTLPRYWKQRYRWARGHQQVCAEHLSGVLRSPHLNPVQKIEAVLFLFSFHIPVVCLIALILMGAKTAGLLFIDSSFNPWPIIPLMLAAPLLEIGGGMALAGVSRRRALDLLLFPVLYAVSMCVCSKSLLDRTMGRAYGWQKTERTEVKVAVA